MIRLLIFHIFTLITFMELREKPCQIGDGFPWLCVNRLARIGIPSMRHSIHPWFIPAWLEIFYDYDLNSLRSISAVHRRFCNTLAFCREVARVLFQVRILLARESYKNEKNKSYQIFIGWNMFRNNSSFQQQVLVYGTLDISEITQRGFCKSVVVNNT